MEMKKTEWIEDAKKKNAGEELKNKDTVKKMSENDRRRIVFLKRTDYDKYIDFLSKHIFPK